MNYEELLNPEQLQAVQHNKGPLLILAGAGSGKTRVLTYRIAHLIEQYNVNPWNILALTFTNKAANEMRERVDSIIGYGAENIWVSTFHSTCVKILRRFITSLGYDSSFTIYDSADQKTLIKEVCKALNIDTKLTKEATILSKISNAKDKLITPEQMLKDAGSEYPDKIYANVYVEYQKRLRQNNALDFDDLIFKTCELFRTDEDALAYYRNRFKYILVDEYQDTNHAQFVLISLLANTINEDGEIENNLCVVGDDDQSIYSFRGADIHNILDFEKKYPSAKVIKLEQNYRSTKNILDVANEVIKNNFNRKSKALWTDNNEGDLVNFTEFKTSYEEAEYVVKEIYSQNRDLNRSYNDYAILYRTNAQSRLFEEKLVQYNVPYKLVGGTNFYARKEIKDILAYLRVIDNAQDDIQVKRIINVPKRGIGQTTIDKFSAYATENNLSFYDTLTHAQSVTNIGRSFEKIDRFVMMIEDLRSKNSSPNYSIEDIVKELIDITGYVRELEQENTVEANTRIEYIDEFMSKVVSYEDEHSEDGSLSNFLEEVSLVADIDNYDESEEKIVLMTLHGSKGLEFPYVYLTGMEDGTFPSYRSLNSGDISDIDEERRLCYVGITRARKVLNMTACKERMINGNTHYLRPSRFIGEIPTHLLKSNLSKPKSAFSSNSSISKDYSNFSFGSKSTSSYNVNPPKSVRSAGGNNLFADNPFIKKGFNTISSLDTKKAKPSKPSDINYQIGDNVEHKKFGSGTVKDLQPKGDDFFVTVEFENSTQRKMLASKADLKKIN